MDDERPIDRGGLNACTGGMVLLLVVIFLVRALHPGQALVENYVGRQIPTAMVAHNIDRGLGFLRPQLETAPFPNYFVVEPPIYELLAVGVKRATSLGLAESGRVSSALVSVLAGWGVYALARQRRGRGLQLLALLTFAVFPLTIRYGAFPAGCGDAGRDRGGPGVLGSVAGAPSLAWRLAGWCLLAVGFAMKITSAFLLIPLFMLIAREGRRRDMVAAVATLVPALLWYGWAEHLIGEGSGSRVARQSVDLAGVWAERTAGIRPL